MTILQALILGLLQGLAEFLPISSSAHLALAPWLFGWPDSGLAFDVSLHLGTLIALAWYFRAEWLKLAHAALRIVRRRRVETTEEKRVLFLLGATVPAGIAGLLLEDLAESTFRTPGIIATALIMMGALLWIADRWASRERALPDMKWRDALLVGLAQVFALMPGVSRSGATITGARLLGFDRSSAAIFSFLMSMPITGAAVAVKLPDAIREGGLSAPLIVGIVAAALSSWFAIAVLLRYVSRHSYGVFALYRLVLGAIVLAIVVARQQ
jgi:undecaprenyl-diphosphatase